MSLVAKVRLRRVASRAHLQIVRETDTRAGKHYGLNATPGEPAQPKGENMTTAPKRAVQIPGDPADQPASDAFEASGTMLGGDDDAADEMSVMQRKLDAQADEIASMRAAIAQLSRASNPQSAKAQELPTMADVMASEPKVPTLTAEGWFVPSQYGAPLPTQTRA
jgi:hypothetical protein